MATLVRPSPTASPTDRINTSTMKALVYHGPGKRSLDDCPIPVITAPTDAIVRIAKTTICGSDLHILKGAHPRS